MTTIERILIELGRTRLAEMTHEDAAEIGHSAGYGEGYKDGYQAGSKDHAQAVLRESESQPVGGDIIAERMAKPALSAILPRRPDDVPAPPDGWDYVGMGREENHCLPFSLYISSYNAEWGAGRIERDGSAPDWHYAIRRTAQPDIWHRFGLLAPSEGGGFYPHTPGDPCPCDKNSVVEIIRHDGKIVNLPATRVVWDVRSVPAATWHCIGWRPALGGAK